jgi:hypothetical protein
VASNAALVVIEEAVDEGAMATIDFVLGLRVPWDTDVWAK